VSNIAAHTTPVLGDVVRLCRAASSNTGGCKPQPDFYAELGEQLMGNSMKKTFI